MKRISMSVATAILLAWSVALGAQNSSTDKPSSPTSSQGSTSQTPGSSTRDRQTTPSGSTKESAATPARQRRASRSPSSSQATNPPQEVTLTGCLQSSEPSGASAASTPPTANTARRTQANATPSFTLSSASQGSSPTSAEPRSVGTAGNQPSSASTSSSGAGSGSYTLQGMDLSRQVGQQVEITGVAVPAAPARNTGSRAAATSGSNDSTASAQRIRVTSVRMVSEHCSGQ